MLIEYPYTKDYLFTALEAAPDLIAGAVAGLPPEEADARPDPDRFTIREIVAHLAEWEPIFLARMRRICDEENPLLEGYDEGRLALDHEYHRADIAEQLRLFRERRAQMVAFLRERSETDWTRTGDRRPEIGILTLEALAFLIPLHDTYHLRQIHEWRTGRQA